MSDLSLTIPQGIRSSLPDEDDAALADMERAVQGWERELNRLMADETDQVSIVDLLDRFESRWEQYDSFVAELRAWGQSPIYAMAWRDLHAALIQQLYDHEDLADRIDRERHARIVEDGIRHSE